MVWNMEISTALIWEPANAGIMVNTTNPNTPKIMAPIRLKVRCITAACLAVREPPALDNIAVTQEPMFCPSVI